MFTFRNATIFFFMLLIAMLILVIAGCPVPVFAFILLVILYFSLLFAVSFFIGSGFYMEALCRIKTEEKLIALTFDDGPDPSVTPMILDRLKGKATATFFCIGKKIRGNENIMRRIDAEGHLIGTHSYSHSFWFDFYSSGRMKREFIRSQDTIFNITGKWPLFFRPPYGIINPTVKKALHSFDYHVTGFSNRSLDSSLKNENKIFRRVTSKLKPGDIILFHDTIKETIPALEKLLIFAESEGYSFIRLDELTQLKAYA
jgi:peptidoglycan/xylan/chitin deacetylase (PgdA/CDA1 family)